MGQQCVRGLFGTQYLQLDDEGEADTPIRRTTLDGVKRRIGETMDLLDRRARHLEEESRRKRRQALALYRSGDRPRARLVFLETRHMARSIETLFALIGNLQALKYQVQQTELVADALQAMSEYTAISRQLKEMEEKFDVETLMDTIRDDSARLQDMEAVLTESLLDDAQEDAVDRELKALEAEEAQATLDEALARETGEMARARLEKKESERPGRFETLMESLSGLLDDSPIPSPPPPLRKHAESAV